MLALLLRWFDRAPRYVPNPLGRAVVGGLAAATLAMFGSMMLGSG